MRYNLFSYLFSGRPIRNVKGFIAEASDTSDNSSKSPTFIAGTVLPWPHSTFSSSYSHYPAIPNIVFVDKCWFKTPRKGKALKIEFTKFDVSYSLTIFPILVYLIHKVGTTSPDGDGDWVTINPPINGISKFFGPDKVPPTTTFPTNQRVTVCFKTRPFVGNLHAYGSQSRFVAILSEGRI